MPRILNYGLTDSSPSLNGAVPVALNNNGHQSVIDYIPGVNKQAHHRNDSISSQTSDDGESEKKGNEGEIVSKRAEVQQYLRMQQNKIEALGADRRFNINAIADEILNFDAFASILLQVGHKNPMSACGYKNKQSCLTQ